MKKIFPFAIVLILLMPLMAACGGSATTPPPATSTPQPTEPAPEPTPEPTPEPAATPSPAGETEGEVEAAAPATEESPAVAENDDAVTDAAPEEAGAASADVRTFVIVPEQSRASYIVAEEFFGGALGQLGIQPGLVDTIGATQEVSGQLELDLANLADPVVSSQFEVNLESLTSDQSRRDNRIRQANLESSRYPLATFTINSLENTPASYSEGEQVSFQATGDITIREITQPATFDVTATLQGNTITGVAETRLKMTDFGFEPPNFANLFSVEDEFTARVEFTFQQQ